MKSALFGPFVLSLVLLVALLVCAPTPSQAQTKPETPFGGQHEIGVAAGYSPVSGPIWGYDENVRYLPVVLKYSYLIRSSKRWNLRYAPELTPFTMLYEPAPSLTNPAAPVRAYGGGVSPEGFEIGLRTGRKVQPFFSNAAGFLYFNRRVLSPDGSQFMYTVDFGAGVRIFSTTRSAIALGYKYQHLSNANISLHNPGTDADTFYVGFSHFHR